MASWSLPKLPSSFRHILTRQGGPRRRWGPPSVQPGGRGDCRSSRRGSRRPAPASPVGASSGSPSWDRGRYGQGPQELMRLTSNSAPQGGSAFTANAHLRFQDHLQVATKGPVQLAVQAHRPRAEALARAQSQLSMRSTVMKQGCGSRCTSYRSRVRRARVRRQPGAEAGGGAERGSGPVRALSCSGGTITCPPTPTQTRQARPVSHTAR